MDLSGSMQGAGGIGGLLAVEEVSNLFTFYPTYDGNGNVSEYLDSTGAVVAHYEYDAFGTTTASTGAKKDDFVHRFSTKPLDAEIGLYYYGFRYYQPQTGRWLSRGPIGEQEGLNLYGFVGNDGMNRVDRLGLDPISALLNPGSRDLLDPDVGLGIDIPEPLGSNEPLSIEPSPIPDFFESDDDPFDIRPTPPSPTPPSPAPPDPPAGVPRCYYTRTLIAETCCEYGPERLGNQYNCIWDSSPCPMGDQNNFSAPPNENGGCRGSLTRTVDSYGDDINNSLDLPW